MNTRRRPDSRRVVVIIVCVAVALWLESRLTLPASDHKFVLVLLVTLFYGYLT